MGFLDKAKDKLQKAVQSIGEETVAVTERDKEPQKKQRKTVSNNYNNSAFTDVDDDTPDFLEIQQESFEEQQKEYDGIIVPEAKNNTLQNVLELLDIPATFEIPQEIFMTEDLDKLPEFSMQVPEGYDVGQVRAFQDKVRTTVAAYIKLLLLRNEHIARLATVIDKLQVDMNNLKFQNEVANGINIMPTEDDDTLSNQNMELRLKNQQLTEKIAKMQKKDELSTNERRIFNDLQDKLSATQRENEQLREELQDVSAQLGALQEENEDFDDDTPVTDGAFGNDDFELSDFHTEDTDENIDDSLELPEIPEEELQEDSGSYSESPTFPVDDEDDDPFSNLPSDDDEEDISHIELLDDSGTSREATSSRLIGTYTVDDDEDDDLDDLISSIMRGE